MIQHLEETLSLVSSGQDNICSSQLLVKAKKSDEMSDVKPFYILSYFDTSEEPWRLQYIPLWRESRAALAGWYTESKKFTMVSVSGVKKVQHSGRGGGEFIHFFREIEENLLMKSFKIGLFLLKIAQI